MLHENSLERNSNGDADLVTARFPPPLYTNPDFGNLPTTLLDWALAYAKAGYSVFPCSADKTPLTPHGFLDATNDPKVIECWWRRNPYADIGWAIPGGLVVLDLDEKDGWHGTRDFSELTGVAADDYSAPVAATPTGGRHVFLAANGKTYPNDRKVVGGIDIRAAGKGYVILPGPGNGRRWIRTFGQCQPPPAPDWVPVARAWTATQGEPCPFMGETSAAGNFLSEACEEISTAQNGEQEATLNSWCFRLGRLVADGGLARDLTYDALVAAALNMRSYKANWPWTERDLRPKIESTLKAGAKSPWLPGEIAYEMDELQNEWASGDEPGAARTVRRGALGFGAASDNGAAANENQKPEAQDAEPERQLGTPKPEPLLATPRLAGRADIVCAADIVMRPKDWLWAGHLLRGAQELLTGIPGLGKSHRFKLTSSPV